MVNYVFDDEIVELELAPQCGNLVALGHEYGGDGVTIGKKA